VPEAADGMIDDVLTDLQAAARHEREDELLLARQLNLHARHVQAASVIDDDARDGAAPVAMDPAVLDQGPSIRAV